MTGPQRHQAVTRNHYLGRPCLKSSWRTARDVVGLVVLVMVARHRLEVTLKTV